MKTYSVSYSSVLSGVIDIEATSEKNAIEIFSALDFDDLFEKRDVLKGVAIESVEKCN